MEETILINRSNINPIISKSKNFKENEFISLPKNYYFNDNEELLKKNFLKKYFEEILNK
jgi:exopolysaccharide biosynthesis predicted pyruvyltransferase EpsI